MALVATLGLVQHGTSVSTSSNSSGGPAVKEQVGGTGHPWVLLRRPSRAGAWGTRGPVKGREVPFPADANPLVPVGWEGRDTKD